MLILDCAIVTILCTAIGGMMALMFANPDGQHGDGATAALGMVGGTLLGLTIATCMLGAMRLQAERVGGERDGREIGADQYRSIRTMRGTSPEVDRAIAKAMADGRITYAEREEIRRLADETDLDRQRCLVAGTCATPPTPTDHHTR